MRLLTAKVTNFGSYKELTFDFSGQNLTLIHGITGSGKSTLQDIPLWVLFGTTAKGGNADDVRNWTNLHEPTSGELTLELPSGPITVYRTRGKPNQNDLYWVNPEGVTIRGKDITETQKILNAGLGIDAETYIAAAYYNEFSPIGQFFSTNASSRREILEKLTDLSLPKLLKERSSDARKAAKKAHVELSARYNKEIGRLEQLKASETETQRSIERWEKDKTRKLKELEAKSANFEMEKQSKIEAIKLKSSDWADKNLSKIEKLEVEIQKYQKTLDISPERCPTCTAPSDAYSLAHLGHTRASDSLRAAQSAINPHEAELEATASLTNTHVIQIEQLKATENPFIHQHHAIVEQRSAFEDSLNVLSSDVELLQQKINDLEQLSDVSYTLRGVLLHNVVKTIESRTNSYLEKYFDSEFRVGFEIVNDDELEVSISRNGYSCYYRQLSKGQRQMLRLCFSVSVMQAAADKAGVHFSVLCLDEPSDGMDDTLKTKAFALFEELALSHESVLVIEHSESIKTLYSNSYHVTLENDESRITHA